MVLSLAPLMQSRGEAVGQQAIGFLLDDRVALARASLQGGSIRNDDVAATPPATM
jgi:hypothetical protein